MVEQTWQIPRNDFEKARIARREFVALLQERADAESDFSAAELIFGELVANAVRHAATNAVVVLRLSTDACLRVSEDSDSEWSDDIRPAEPHAVGGRGLYIVRSLAEKLEFERLDPGLAVSAVLPVRLREPRA